MKEPTTKSEEKRSLDEKSFQQLLSAAYVVQQHNERLHAGQKSDSGFSRVLSEIVGLQEQIRGRRMDSLQTLTLIAHRTREITHANGVAIGIVDLETDEFEYRAANGSAACEAGSRGAASSSLSAECLATGLILQSPEAEGDRRLDAGLCRALGIKSLIATPIHQDGKVIGVLELHFASAHAFQEQDVRVCQMMSALIAESIGPAVRTPSAAAPPEPVQTKEYPLPTDPASMLAALEKLRPQIEHMVKQQESAAAAPAPPPAQVTQPVAEAKISPVICRCCGHQLEAGETFCGICGAACHAQSTWGSLWDLQRKAEHEALENPPANAEQPAHEAPLDVFTSELEDIVAKFSAQPMDGAAPKSAVPEPAAAVPAPENFFPAHSQQPMIEDFAHEDDQPEEPTQNIPSKVTPIAGASKGSLLSWQPPSVEEHSSTADDLFPSFATDNNLPALSNQPPEYASEEMPEEYEAPDGGLALVSQEGAPGLSAGNPVWTSAAKTKQWLETQDPERGWLFKTWQTQRANIYLAASAGLFVAVLLGWGSPSAPSFKKTESVASVSKPSTADAPASRELTFTEKMLVQFGLAEPPPRPVQLGNPDAKVWVDVHTALYYCSGTDLYGKTANGKFTTQRDAQQDQFQPALRKVCD